MVWIQCGQRAFLRQFGDERVRGDAFRRRSRRGGLELDRMETQREAQRAGRDLRRRGGLVAITPASGFVKPMPAMVIGFVAGIVCYLMVAKVKARFGYDDSLDAFGVHGIGGTVGAILTGIFAVSAVNPILKDSMRKVLASGLIEGNRASTRESVGWRGDCLGIGNRWALLPSYSLWTNWLASAFHRSRKFKGWIFRNTGRKGITGRLRSDLVLRLGIVPFCEAELPQRFRFWRRDSRRDQKSRHAHTIPTQQ